MTTTRAALSTVLAHVRTEIEQEAKQAAGANTILSKAEQQALKDGVTKTAAADLRAAGGTGTTVTVDALVDAASSKLEALLGTVNRPGRGAGTVTQAEVKALAALDPDAGVRVARAWELITGKAIDLQGYVPLPVPRDMVGELNVVRDAVKDFITRELQKAAGSNDSLSANERASLHSGHLRDAAFATPAPRNVARVTAHLLGVVDQVMAASGIDLSTLGQPAAAGGLMAVPLSRNDFFPLVANDPEIAGLLADAVLATTGTRPDQIPGLPVPRFGASPTPTPTPTPPPTPSVDPTLGGPVLTGIPGAHGVVRTLTPARADAFAVMMEQLIELMNLSRDGAISIGEATAFVKRASGGSIWDAHVPPENRPRTIERLLFDVREAAWQRLGRPPTTAEVKRELVRVADRAREIGHDERGNGFGARGPVALKDDPAAILFFDHAREPALDLHNEPWVRFIDHEGDVDAAKRRPLDLAGPASRAIRNLVFHFNTAGNDNHWPLWSGRATSRYRLDATETRQVLTRLRAELPARRAELFQAMVDWLSQPRTPGMLYVNVEARSLVDTLAVELGHPYRSPAGDTPAPSMPSP